MKWQMLRELRTSLRENAMVMDNLEEAVEDEQPVLFSEYLSGTDAERANLDVGRPDPLRAPSSAVPAC